MGNYPDMLGGIKFGSCLSSPKLALLLTPGCVSIPDGGLGASARSDSCSQAGLARWLRRLTCAEFVWDGLGNQAGLIRSLPLCGMLVSERKSDSSFSVNSTPKLLLGKCPVEGPGARSVDETNIPNHAAITQLFCRMNE